MGAGGRRRRSPARVGPRRSWGGLPLRRSPRIAQAPPSAATESPPPTPQLRVGGEVEVRLDGHGFFGTWYEATVVGLVDRRSPPLYAVSYSHIRPDDGLPKGFAPTHIRPRPPPPPPASSPPRFLVHDIVEAFDRGGWWSGMVVAAAEDDPAVMVKFPITGEVISFGPDSVRPRRDYVDGDWVPARGVIAEEAQPKRALKVYNVGEKVEVWKDREVYGYSWFAATVTMAVDRCSYILEYSEQEGEEKATDYMYWDCIRPAMDHSLREGEFKLVPGAAVEAYCEGAWTPGVLHRIVEEDVYEVRVNKGEASQMVTKVVELLKPNYRWDGNRWRIVEPKRKANSRHQCASTKCSSSPEYSDTKKARKELQQQEAILAGGSEHVPVSASHESPSRNHCTNFCSPLPENKGGTTHSIQALQRGGNSSCDLNENRGSCMKEINSDLSISLECQTSSSQTRQVSMETNNVSSSKMAVYARKLKRSKGLKETEAPQSPVNVTSAVQNTERKKSAECIKHSSSILGGTEFQIQPQVDRTLEATLNLNEESDQKLPPMVPPGIELMVNKTGVDTLGNLLQSYSIVGSSLPSNLSASRISSCHQAVFVKSSPAWLYYEQMDVFKNSPQQPHFGPLQGFLLSLREGIALGLMQTFVNSVKVIRNLSLADNMDSIEEIKRDLLLLEQNGFIVEYLQESLNRLVKIKTGNTSHLQEKGILEAEIQKNTTSSSEIDLLLDENNKAVAELEKNLSELRCMGQKIAKDKEDRDAELSRLKTAYNNVDEACGDDEQQFHVVLAELQCKRLT